MRHGKSRSLGGHRPGRTLCYEIISAQFSSLYLIRPQLLANKSVPFSFPFPTYHSKGTGVPIDADGWREHAQEAEADAARLKDELEAWHPTIWTARCGTSAAINRPGRPPSRLVLTCRPQETRRWRSAPRSTGLSVLFEVTARPRSLR